MVLLQMVAYSQLFRFALSSSACYDAVVNYGYNRCPTALDEFPVLKSWKEMVESNAGIKKYLSSDSYTGLMKFGPDTLGK